eukprot:1138345-Pelagomonas_calceolata.AAC.2
MQALVARIRHISCMDEHLVSGPWHMAHAECVCPGERPGMLPQGQLSAVLWDANNYQGCKD